MATMEQEFPPLFGLDSQQVHVLSAFAATIIAPLTTEEETRLISNVQSVKGEKLSVDKTRAYAQMSGGTLQVATEMVKYLYSVAYPDQLRDFERVMWLLSKRMGSVILANSTVSFVEMPRQDRERVILSLINSRLTPLRALMVSILSLTGVSAYGMPRNADGSRNDFLDLMKYPEHPKMLRDVPPATEIWRPVFCEFETNQDETAIEMTCDVVIVGSGAGGGVVAAELAGAGHNVIVIDKALYTHPTDFPYREKESFELLYDRAGALCSRDGSIRMMAGSVWGGGTTVNWSACLALAGKVREEWATDYDLPFFVSREFSETVDIISERAGISASAIKHNASNTLLKEGMRRMGITSADVAQNTARHTHECGHCTFGCPYGEKQSSLLTFLRDAAETGNTRFVQGCHVERVLHQDGRAIGIIGSVTTAPNAEPRAIKINAKRVIVSAGSFHSPTLLRKSGLRNPHIGRHLRLHPSTHVFGVFQNSEKPINTYKGSILTVVATEDKRGDEYGSKIEICAMHPGMYSSCIPWRGAENHKRLMSLYDRVVPVVVITRDSDATKGSVALEPHGEGRVDYSVAYKDQVTVADGVILGIKAMIAAGATEVFTNQIGVEPFVVDPLDASNTLSSPRFQKYLKQVRAYGFPPTWVPMFSAHQMGTCRMAGSPKKGACDPNGRVWELHDLYVADASLFPTASGVNPMLTVMTIAHHVAQQVKKSLIASPNL
ncbi:hypothetical protein DFS34DRAFT_45328 [Phlyctochytrium arcticum]|nr:hypothetical protein DFS34DRAFT_45328 [Phlyctochytrium arcticum]